MNDNSNYTFQLLNEFAKKGQQQLAGRKKMISKLKKQKRKEVDLFFNLQHKEIFSQFNCLQCANCCKTISPILKQDDMDRIAAYLKMPVSKFLQQYLEMDEDGDFVFRQKPCPMLADDNRCKVYDVRPEACRDYPHTARKKMKQLLDLTYENSLTCPAVWKMMEGT
jgi:Fe-S-cluster containining protein